MEESTKTSLQHWRHKNKAMADLLTPKEAADALVSRAKKAVPNQDLTWLAVLAARQHKYAIDYIEQAPVLVIGALFGARSFSLSAAEKEFAARRFRRIEGKKLKQAMEEFHLPYALRKLRSTAIAPGYSNVIWDMRSIPPSTLSQAIPEKVDHQVSWLRAVKAAKERAARRGRQLDRAHLHWLAARLGGSVPVLYQPRELKALAGDLADMFMAGRFNSAWTLEEASTAHGRWSVDLAKDSSAAFLTTHGVGISHQVDYSPQPNAPVVVDGFEIVPLRSGEDLIEEGTLMRHCVPSYMRDILAARSCIYSVRNAGRRVATLELASGYGPAVVKQIKGPCNARVRNDVLAAANAFAASVPKKKSAMDGIKRLFNG